MFKIISHLKMSSQLNLNYISKSKKTTNFVQFPCQSRFNHTCWSCGKLLTDNESKNFFCPCPSILILPVNQSNNYFKLFGIDVKYKIHKDILTKVFRQLMRKLHPDLYTLKSEVFNNDLSF